MPHKFLRALHLALNDGDPCQYFDDNITILTMCKSYLLTQKGTIIKSCATLPHSKSQSLTNTFTETLRGNLTDDEAKAETIRSLRQSFASLFSD